MKINKIYGQFIDKNIYKTKEENKKQSIIENESSVNVEISKSAKELVKKMEHIEDTKISEKVEKIRRSILDGTYKVSSEEIADKILKTIDIQKGKCD